MNPANLQLEGLYAALAALVIALRRKGYLSAEEIDAALAEAEEANLSGHRKDLSPANLEAIRFPFRYLRAANDAPDGASLSFFDLAAEVGMRKDEEAE